VGSAKCCSSFETSLRLSQRLIEIIPPDQGWSHTDCTSFQIIQQQNILEAVAYGKHFEQAGFIALLR
jgi:predicted nucleic acid-binding protein